MNAAHYQILCICTGNLCRSPMAEIILKQKLQKKHIQGIDVGSAGVHAVAGCRAPLQVRLVCAENGLNIDEHRAKQVTQSMVQKADLILVMEKRHLLLLTQLDSACRKKIRFLNQLSDSDIEVEIRDPFGHDVDVYRQCFNEMQQYLIQGLPWIKSRI